MIQIPDAPWIRETERTGYCSSGWWNTPEDGEDEEEGASGGRIATAAPRNDRFI